MINFYKILNTTGEFVPYYERENDFKRVATLHLFASVLFSPIFCFLVYETEVPKVYFYIGIANFFCFPIYTLVCYFIRFLNRKLIYFFIGHYFVVTFFAFQQLLQSGFDVYSLFCFYALYAVLLFVSQRLYPAILYNLFVISLILYGFQVVDHTSISKDGIFGMILIIALCSILVFFSRQRMINSVEDYSNYLRKIVNNPGIGYLLFKIKNEEFILVDNNQEVLHFFGSEQKNISQCFIDLLDNEEKEKIKNLRPGSEFISFQKKSVGIEKYTLDFNVSILELKNGFYWLIRLTDVTKEERERQNFKSVIDNSPEGIIIIFNNEVLYTNTEAHRLLNRDSIDLSDIFIKADQIEFSKTFADHVETKKIRQKQLYINRQGASILTDVTFVTTNFEEKEATMVILKDISIQHQLSKEMLRAELAEETNKKLASEIKERIKAEKQLQEQFLRSNAIFDSSSNTLLLTLDTQLNFSSFNTHCRNYFFYLAEKQMGTGNNFDLFFEGILQKSDLRVFKSLLKKVLKGESRQIEVAIKPKKKEIWLEIFINPIFNTEGVVNEISLVAHDITEKKKAEKGTAESLKEKEVLLKEIHHRVKNNLQVISSILNLQSTFVKDKRTLEILEESRNRIRSMAIIHESLYQTTNFSSIDFSAYLDNLSHSLVASYSVGLSNIKLITQLEKVELVLDQAIPCGLMVNELVTNTLKYGFPESKTGEIHISLKEVKNKVFLRVGDNGVGFKNGFKPFESETLGLQLVSTLVEQLEGEVHIDSSKGVNYLIIFDKAKL